MEDLKELVIQTLESSGQLGTLRAQLRSAVFKIIDGQESGRGAQWENAIAQKAMETATGQVACELFRDFLEHFKMDYTLNVFLPESNLPNEKRNKSDLCKKLGLNQDVQGPLLFSLIEKSSSISNEKPLIGQEKSQGVQEKFQPFQQTSQQIPQQQNIQPNQQQFGFQKQSQQQQQQVKQEEDLLFKQKQPQQQQQLPEKGKQEQQQAAEKSKQTQQQQQQNTDKSKQTQLQQQQVEKPKQITQQQPAEKLKLEPLPDIKGGKLGKLPPLNVQDENEQEKKRLAEMKQKIDEMEQKDKGNVLAEFKQEEEQYSEEIEEDIEEEDEEIIKQSTGEAESSRKQAESMGISSSLGMDPSVDSLELEKYDYFEKIQKIKQ